MGWDYTRGATKQDIVNERIRDWSNHGHSDKHVTHSVVGQHLWQVREHTWPMDYEKAELCGKTERYISLDLLASDHGYGWGYKAMDESAHPYYYDCPLKFLNMAPVASQEWRDLVHKFHADKISKKNLLSQLQVGMRIRLREGCKPNEFTITDIFHTPRLKIFAENGRKYRIPTTKIEAIIA